jgi:Flp pilus assembly protein TadB
MLFYTVLLMASCPILCPLWLASAYWLLPLKPSVVVAAALFLIWGVVAFPLAQRRYRLEDGLNVEQP